MATGSDHLFNGKMKIFFKKLWKWVKRIFIFLFIAQLLYIVILKWVYPPITITQLISWISGHGLARDYIGKNSISVNAKLAFIAAEDQLFPDHNGFDIKAIKKAMKHNSKRKKVRGASTISQQTAKNVFLWQSRSWFRKGLEVYFTFMIEKIWGKKRILEVYLNVIETGDGIFGIEAASKKYFNKSSSKLTRQQSAMIAASLPNPKRFTVKPPTPYVSSRALWVMRQMNNLESDPDIQKILK